MARDLMSDEEWVFFEQFILSVRAPNGRKPTNYHLVLDGVFWIARTGAPWRVLPEEFGKWSSVYATQVGDTYQWTDKMSLFMRQWYIWSESDFFRADKAQARYDAKSDCMASTMPEILKKE